MIINQYEDTLVSIITKSKNNHQIKEQQAQPTTTTKITLLSIADWQTSRFIQQADRSR